MSAGYGVCERSDGVRYEGEWLNNQRHGFGVTVFPDGSKEEGRYKFNKFSSRKRHSLPLRSRQTKNKVAFCVTNSHKAKDTAISKAHAASTRFFIFNFYHLT